MFNRSLSTFSCFYYFMTFLINEA
uniref:Uncharacterized protein n=1 Tax=mine drainage metagenome TaxID=410659 RepID=E6PIA7_9ZZZZ